MRISDCSSDVCSSDLLVLLLFDLSDNSSDAAWIIDDARRRKERRTRPDLRESDGREGASHREGGYARKDTGALHDYLFRRPAASAARTRDDSSSSICAVSEVCFCSSAYMARDRKSTRLNSSH